MNTVLKKCPFCIVSHNLKGARLLGHTVTRKMGYLYLSLLVMIRTNILLTVCP